MKELKTQIEGQSDNQDDFRKLEKLIREGWEIEAIYSHSNNNNTATIQFHLKREI